MGEGDNGRVADPESPQPRHGRLTLTQRGVRVGFALAAVVALVATAFVVGAIATGSARTVGTSPADPPPAAVPVATALPVPSRTGVTPASCDDPTVAAAVAGGTDAEIIAAFGGAAAFRQAVATGSAPCVSLADPARLWVVVDKARPLDPIEFAPATLVAPEGVQRVEDVLLRPDAAAALTELVAAAASEGAGVVGLNSGYRSYASQAATYRGYVRRLGEAAADQQSARAGYSEHQTGLAADVTACDAGCAALEAFGGTRQAEWVAANAWRFGFVIRYEDSATGVTGYGWEPWHLRYLGLELAEAYRDGGFRTLEEFFALSAAPDYTE